MKKKYNYEKKSYPYIFVLPAVIVFTVFFIIPVAMGFGYAFTDWNTFNTKINFVGLEQFKTVLKDSVFMIAITNTLKFAVIVTIIQNIFGMVLALIMNRKMFSQRYLRGVFFLPSILSTLIIGYAFSAILQPNGIFNRILSNIGLASFQKDWLMDGTINIYTISATNIWMFMGFSMVIYITGLQSIPHDVIESSQIDGASPLRTFFSIILPMLAPSITVNIIMSIVGSMKVFDLVFVLTKGGPGNSSEVVNTLVFQQFGLGSYGYGTAISVILFIVICILAFPTLYFLKRKEFEQ